MTSGVSASRQRNNNDRFHKARGMPHVSDLPWRYDTCFRNNRLWRKVRDEGYPRGEFTSSFHGIIAGMMP